MITGRLYQENSRIRFPQRNPSTPAFDVTATGRVVLRRSQRCEHRTELCSLSYIVRCIGIPRREAYGGGSFAFLCSPSVVSYESARPATYQGICGGCY